MGGRIFRLAAVVSVRLRRRIVSAGEPSEYRAPTLPMLYEVERAKLLFRFDAMEKRRLSLWIVLAFVAAVGEGRAGQPPNGVEVQAAVSTPQAVAGTVIDFLVTIRAPEGWITFDIVQPLDSALPTTIRFQNSDAFVPLENFSSPRALERPDPLFNNRIVRYYTFSPTFRRPILLSPHLEPGLVRIDAMVDFQVCDEDSGRCYLVRRHPISAIVEIVQRRRLVTQPEAPPADRPPFIEPAPRIASEPINQTPDAAPPPVKPPQSNDGGSSQVPPTPIETPTVDPTSAAPEEDSTESTERAQAAAVPDATTVPPAEDKIIPLAEIEVDQYGPTGSAPSLMVQGLAVLVAAVLGFAVARVPGWWRRRSG